MPDTTDYLARKHRLIRFTPCQFRSVNGMSSHTVDLALLKSFVLIAFMVFFTVVFLLIVSLLYCRLMPTLPLAYCFKDLQQRKSGAAR